MTIPVSASKAVEVAQNLTEEFDRAGPVQILIHGPYGVGKGELLSKIQDSLRSKSWEIVNLQENQHLTRSQMYIAALLSDNPELQNREVAAEAELATFLRDNQYSTGFLKCALVVNLDFTKDYHGSMDDWHHNNRSKLEMRLARVLTGLLTLCDEIRQERNLSSITISMIAVTHIVLSSHSSDEIWDIKDYHELITKPIKGIWMDTLLVGAWEGSKIAEYCTKVSNDKSLSLNDDLISWIAVTSGGVAGYVECILDMSLKQPIDCVTQIVNGWKTEKAKFNGNGQYESLSDYRPNEVICDKALEVSYKIWAHMLPNEYKQVWNARNAQGGNSRELTRCDRGWAHLVKAGILIEKGPKCYIAPQWFAAYIREKNIAPIEQPLVIPPSDEQVKVVQKILGAIDEGGFGLNSSNRQLWTELGSAETSDYEPSSEIAVRLPSFTHGSRIKRPALLT